MSGYSSQDDNKMQFITVSWKAILKVQGLDEFQQSATVRNLFLSLASKTESMLSKEVLDSDTDLQTSISHSSSVQYKIHET